LKDKTKGKSGSKRRRRQNMKIGSPAQYPGKENTKR